MDRSEQSEPYKKFFLLYDDCIKNNQSSPEAIAISTYDTKLEQTDVRYVNLKYILGEEWIFFTNYNSVKAKHIETNNNISAAIYWNMIDVQIRLKGTIKKTSKSFSDMHFSKRSIDKNALAISSKQSQPIDSYENIISNYKNALAKKHKFLKLRPDYWGGYSLKPYSIEFWKGQESRINKREVYTKKMDAWDCKILQP